MSQELDVAKNRSETGRAWVFGDNINTDVLAPGQYIKLPIEKLAVHCLESVDANFASEVSPGDIIVGGRNFGIGSSREQAAEALKILGVAGVVAESFGGIFYRNAINLGLPVFTPIVSETNTTETVDNNGSIANIKAGERLSLSLQQATLSNHDSGLVVSLQPLPDFLLEMLQAGGLVAVLEKRFGIAN